MILRILLVESDAESALFLRDVLEEMTGGEYWSEWVELDTFDAPTWAVAQAILATKPIDVILLNLNLADSQGMETFRRAQAAAAHIPVVLLAEDTELSLAEHLVREGAQDFILKDQVDCLPLAHAIRAATNRQRAFSAARASAMRDPLTGLLNRSAFQVFAERDRNIAQNMDRRMAVLIAELPGLTSLATQHGDQQRDLALMEIADQLRSCAGATDLLARIDADRFAMAVLEAGDESLEAKIEWFEHGSAGPKMMTGSAIFDPGAPTTLDQLLEQASSQLYGPRTSASGAAARRTLSRVAATASRS